MGGTNLPSLTNPFDVTTLRKVFPLNWMICYGEKASYLYKLLLDLNCLLSSIDSFEVEFLAVFFV